MKELLNHLEYTKLFLVIVVGMIALTYLTHIIFSKKKRAKFIPGTIAIMIGLYGLLTIDSRIIFLDDIGNLTIFVMGTSLGLIGILVAGIIEVLNKENIIKNEKTF